MTLRSSDLQSDSDLDSICNSCDVFYMWLSVVVNCNCKWMWKWLSRVTMKDHPLVQESSTLSHSLGLFRSFWYLYYCQLTFKMRNMKETQEDNLLAGSLPLLNPCRDPIKNNKDHWLTTPWPLQVGPGDDLVLAPSHVEVKRWIWNNVHGDCDGGGFWRYL